VDSNDFYAAAACHFWKASHIVEEVGTDTLLLPFLHDLKEMIRFQCTHHGWVLFSSLADYLYGIARR
jgi:hypothetical protein